jgi:RimJ/RimL family protein N-acetyltransferase
MSCIALRDVREADLPIFFEHQLDPDANRMAAFSAEDPADRDAFMAKWRGILSDETIPIRTIVCDGQVAGNVLCWTDAELGTPEVSYWLGKEFWGRGIATRALAMFLEHVRERPLYGRAARDNVGSLRVLEKCGFVLKGAGKGFANARGEEVEELILELRAEG